MEFNCRTKRYLKEVDAVLLDSKYKVFSVNFITMKAFVNKQDTYKKRNGKKCHVTHHFGRWMSFTKQDVSYKIKKYTSYDSSVHGLEETKGQSSCKYLKPNVKQRLINEYKSTLSNSW